MYVVMRVEETREEYKPEAEKNRLEVYESLLLDTSSALWRELVHRKEGRNASAVSATNTSNTSRTAITRFRTVTEKSEVFDIDSEEEEKKLPVKDPSRDVGRVRRCER